MHQAHVELGAQPTLEDGQRGRLAGSVTPHDPDDGAAGNEAGTRNPVPPPVQRKCDPAPDTEHTVGATGPTCIRLKCDLEPAGGHHPRCDRCLRAQCHEAIRKQTTSETGQAFFEKRLHTPGVCTRGQVCELLALSTLRSGALPSKRPPADLIPCAVLEDEANDEGDIFELRGREPEDSAGTRRPYVGNLDRQPVVLRPIVADDELVVGMDMHEPVGLGVESVEALDAWNFLARTVSPHEAEAREKLREPASLSCLDEKIDVVLTRNGAVDRSIALPVAIRDARFLELPSEADAQLERLIDRGCGAGSQRLCFGGRRSVHRVRPTASRRLAAREPAFSSSRSYSDM